MPSILHEGLVLLFRNRPSLAAEMVQDVLGIRLPDYSSARIEPAEFAEVVPTQFHADLVVLLEGTPAFAIVVEVQLARDEDKRKTWPLYLASLRARVGCQTALLVVTPDDAIARWAEQPIDLGHPGFTLRPLVLGPGAIPLVTDEQTIQHDPELGVLSAMAHPDAASLQVARALLTGPPLESGRAAMYLDLIGAELSGAARAAFEELMDTKYEFQTEFFRKLYPGGLRQAIEIQEALKAMTVQAKKSIFGVLEARGLDVSESARAQIVSCHDLQTLDSWLRAAAVANRIEDIFTSA